jgi:hypothetical protein
MKNALRFVAQAFFGGCFGCLGAWITTVLIIVLLGIIFSSSSGSGLLGSVSGFVQSIPNMLGNTIGEVLNEDGGSNSPQAGMHYTELPCPKDPPQDLTIFLTVGNDPTTEHISQISTGNSTNARFWVQAPQWVAVKFVLVITHPDGSTQVFGPPDHPEFTSDPGGLPFSVGGFGSPAELGDYQLTIYVCDSITAGSLYFQVTP